MITHGFPLIWLVPAAISLHNMEEALWLPGWSEKVTGRRYQPVGVWEFRFTVSILTLLAFVIAVLTYRPGIKSMWGYLLDAYALGQAINIMIPHMVASIATKSYSPGLLSGYLIRSAIIGLVSLQLILARIFRGNTVYHCFNHFYTSHPIHYSPVVQDRKIY